ncbi:MAG: prepilin-type N-terminal cleavage/methylation domain-containing protein [Candidatus Omnitrophica bacterium]|nr:prepilin-type N-terminal cleavage/methylation domain-containing protein [Candidatus Omnitrophota bacterium]
MNVKTNKKGFTLTEILIVLVIAGILLALILPNSLKAVQRGNVTANKSDIQSCSTAALICYSENANSWASCDTVAELVSGDYLKSAPAGVTMAQDQTTGGYSCQ